MKSHFIGILLSVDIVICFVFHRIPGHYMYIEASSPRVRGDNAQLLSPSFSSPQGACLNFYYNMYGVDMGILNVIMKDGLASIRLWTKSGNQGNKWQLAQTTIGRSSNYTIMFEAIVGSGYRSDVAIDDIAIKTGNCPLPGMDLNPFPSTLF